MMLQRRHLTLSTPRARSSRSTPRSARDLSEPTSRPCGARVLTNPKSVFTSPVTFSPYDFMLTNSAQSWYAVINLHGGPDSQISVPASASAYTHRETLWMVQHYGFSTNHLPPLLDSTKAVITRLTSAVRAGVPAS